MKGIKKSISSFSRTVFTAIFAAFAVAGIVSAATTISTDVTTAGNVYASSTVQATGAITGYGALNITGVSTLTGLGLFNGGASSTLFSSYGPAYFGATATSSFGTNGQLTLTSPTSVVLATNGSGLVGSALGTGYTWTGLQQFQGSASSTLFSSYGPAYFGATATSSFATNGALTLVNALTYGGVTLSNAVTGTGNMVLSASPTLTGTAVLAGANFSGIASTTQLKVGSDQISTVSGMIFGSCTLVSVSVTATSSSYTTCTGATGVTSSYSVFLQVNNVMPSGLIVDAASSTATTGTLELRIFNADATNTPSTLTTGTPTINFWAIR